VKKVICLMAFGLSFLFGGAKLHAAELKVGDQAPDFFAQGIRRQDL